jgi:hypothetical protein
MHDQKRCHNRDSPKRNDRDIVLHGSPFYPRRLTAPSSAASFSASEVLPGSGLGKRDGGTVMLARPSCRGDVDFVTGTIRRGYHNRERDLATGVACDSDGGSDTLHSCDPGLRQNLTVQALNSRRANVLGRHNLAPSWRRDAFDLQDNLGSRRLWRRKGKRRWENNESNGSNGPSREYDQPVVWHATSLPLRIRLRRRTACGSAAPKASAEAAGSAQAHVEPPRSSASWSLPAT